jgi:serine phosphatase RsbU (regulator of sigma subunit)
LFGAGSKDPDLLKEYQRIVQETEAIRQISIEEAGLKAWRAHEDKDGYLWFAGDGNIRRFNGNSFQDMFEHYPAAERDSLKGIVSLDDKTLLVYGTRYVYAWDGVNFSRYLFDEEESIQCIQKIHNSALVRGSSGHTYAFWEAGELSRFKTSESLSLNKFRTTRFSWGEDGSLRVQRGYLDLCGSSEALYLLSFEYSLTEDREANLQQKFSWEQDIYVRRISPAREDSVKVFDQAELNSCTAGGCDGVPELYTDAQGRSWLYQGGTPHLIRLDPHASEFKNVNKDADVNIISINATSSGKDLVFYQKQEQYYLAEIQSFLKGAKNVPAMDFGAYNPRRSQLLLSLDKESVFLSMGNMSGIYRRPESFVILGNKPAAEGYYVWQASDLLSRSFGNQDYSEQNTFSTYANSMLAICYPSSDIAGVRIMELYDEHGELLKRQEIADASSDWDLIGFNHNNDTVLLRSDKSYYVIPIRKRIQRIASLPQSSFANQSAGTDLPFSHEPTNWKILPGKESLTLLAEELIYGQGTQYSCSLYEYKGGNITEIEVMPDHSLIHHIEEKGLLYFIKNRDELSKREIILYDLNLHKASSVCTLNDEDKYLFCEEDLFVVTANAYKKYYNGQFHSAGVFSAPEKAFGELVKSYKGGLTSLWKLLRSSGIDSKGNIFFPKQSLQLDRDSNQLSRGISFFDFSSESIAEPMLQDGAVLELRFPSFILNIFDNSVKYQPSWYRISTAWDGVYVQHLEDRSGKWHSRISKFADGKLILKPDDAVFAETDPEIIETIQTANTANYRIAHSREKLYYIGEDKGSIDLDKYKAMGDYLNVYGIREHDGKLWLNIGTSLLKHDPKRNLTFQYGEKDGLPGEIEAIWIDPQGLVYVLGKEAIFTMQQAAAGMILNIPWFTTGSSRHSSAQPLKLSYKQNSITIPIELPSVTDPGNCMLEYRLKGVDKKWQRTPYQETIEYQRLRPGRYEFEIKAFSQDGEESETKAFKIRILPPWYAAWWAYLLYILILITAIKLIYDARVRKLKEDRKRLAGLVEAGTREIREQHRKMSDSIEYASLIQRSILPPQEEMIKAFPDSFVIWRPRDVVGGDFYWLHRVPDTGEVLFAVIDCTGHGVPGALLSMTVNTLLNNIVKEHGAQRLNEILSLLHKGIAGTLHQDNENSRQDGLAISIIKFHKDRNYLCFAGAEQSLLYYDILDHEVKQERGSRFSLGGAKWHQELSFEERRIEYVPGTKFYLFSDGIVDQAISSEGRTKRLGSKGFIAMIERAANLPMPEQAAMFNQELDDILAEHEQRDDICVVGFVALPK